MRRPFPRGPGVVGRQSLNRLVAGAMLLQIDHGSDGSIDQTVPLNNQAGRLYLPLLLRYP